MPQIREQIAMVHLPPSKTLKYLFHVRKTTKKAPLSTKTKVLFLSDAFQADFVGGTRCALRAVMTALPCDVPAGVRIRNSSHHGKRSFLHHICVANASHKA